MSNAVQFTPGPWRSCKVDEVPPHKTPLVVGGSIAVYSECRPEYGEGKANAALVVAAPDLYEALEALLEESRAHQELWSDGVWAMADAALKKARGES